MSQIDITPEQAMTGIFKAFNDYSTAVEGLPDLYDKLAEVQAIYDKQLGLEIARLKADNMPISIIDKTAKGIVAEFKKNLIIAEGILKYQLSKIESLKAKVNAYQSILSYRKTEMERQKQM